MKRHTILYGALAAGALALTLSGCGAMEHMGQMGQSQSGEMYEATLSGAQEVPPTSSGGSGKAEVRLHGDNSIEWKVTYSGLSAPPTAGHIHGPAAAGQNAGVQVPFASVATQPITGKAQLNATQVADLKAGRMYVNLHTPSSPGGEIRGQLRRGG